jgi:hypothetical protein
LLVKTFCVTISVVGFSEGFNEVAMQTVPDQSEPDGVCQGHEPKRRPETILTAGDLRGLIILVVVAFIVIAGLVARYLVNEHSASIKFFTEAFFSFAALVVIITQAVIYWRQAEFMKQQSNATERNLELTNRIIEKMEAQRELMVIEIETSQTQARTMLISVEQNERAVKAAEDDAKTAREALYVGDAPYFGVTGIVFTDLDLDRYPGVDISFMNGGRTPAWHFHATPTLIFGNNPESRERWDMQTKAASPANNFYPTGDQKTLEYKQIGFAYTADHRRAITERTAYLFVQVTLSYQDRRKDRHIRTFRFTWDDATGQFVEFESLYGY